MTETAREALVRRSKEAPASDSAPQKSVRELLAERASGKKFEVPQPKAVAPTEPPGIWGRFKRLAFSSPESMLAEDPNASVEGAAQAGLGAAEGAASAATGIPASMAGGLNMSTSLIGGRGVDDSLRRFSETQDFLTYAPRTEQGQQAAQGIADVAGLPGQVGRAAGDLAADAGAPAWMSAGLAAAPDAALMFAGGKAAKSERPIRPEVERPKASSDEAHPFAHESLSSSAVAPDLSQLSPPVRAEFETVLAKGGKIDKEAFNRVKEADSLGIQLSEGQAKMDPDLISRENNARAKEMTAARYQQQNQQLIDKLDDFRAEAAPNAVGNDHIQNGQALIDAYKAVDEPARAEVSAKYQALRDAAGGDFPIDTPGLLDSVKAALKKDHATNNAPPDIMAALDESANKGSMTLEDFEGLRSSLARIQRESSDGQVRHAAKVIHRQLEEMPLKPEAAELKGLADAARKAARERFQRIEADPAYKAAVNDSAAAGEASALADDFVSKYVVRGKAANIARMRENLAVDPQAAETIAAGVMNYIKSKSGVNLYTNEGNFSQAGYNRALAEVTPKLDKLVPPTTAESLQTLGNVARYTQAQPRGSYVNNSNTFTAAAGEMVGTKLEMLGNAVLPGAQLGTTARGKLAARADLKSAEKAWKPGAGLEAKPVKLNKLLNQEKKK